MTLKRLKEIAAKPLMCYDNNGNVIVNDDAIVIDYIYLDPFTMIVKVEENENE